MTSSQDSTNQSGENVIVTPDERATRDGQTGLVVWFTGLSGAGKTTLAVSVERRLFDLGYRTFLIDGDLLRAGLCSDLGYGEADRHENVRRAGVVSSLMANAGLICLTALISPFRADRARARSLLPAGCFLEVYVNAPLSVCEARDAKGLYRRARANEIPNFTGISSVYEPPESPDFEVRTDLLSVDESIAEVLKVVRKRVFSLREQERSSEPATSRPSTDQPIYSRSTA
jgi:adenylyl-sulfate kinase